MAINKILAADEMPEQVGFMHFDRWTGSYRDAFNDIFVSKRFGRKTWELTSRGPGNSTVRHSKHHVLARALNAANNLRGASAGAAS